MITSNYRNILYNRYFLNQSFKPKNFDEVLNHRSYYDSYFLNRFLPEDKNTSILDIGCGYGCVLASLQKLGYSNFTGVDSSTDAIEFLQSTNLKQKVVESELVTYLEKAVQQKTKWNVILAIDILEHFTKDELTYVLSLIKKVINSSGIIIIKIPNAQSLFAGTTVFGDFTHEIACTPSSLKQLLNASSFSEVAVYEAHPVPHTFMSSIRFCLWQIVRIIFTLIWAIESGELNNSKIWTRSFYCIAKND